MVRGICTSGDRIDTVVGAPGSGKPVALEEGLAVRLGDRVVELPEAYLAWMPATSRITTPSRSTRLKEQHAMWPLFWSTEGLHS
jgi:hypothetical protein